MNEEEHCNIDLVISLNLKTRFDYVVLVAKHIDGNFTAADVLSRTSQEAFDTFWTVLSPYRDETSKGGVGSIGVKS